MFPMRVLVVEDNVDVAWALSQVVRNLGHDVVSCGTPKLALEAVGSLVPDLVSLDIELLEMDGDALAIQLRQRGLTTSPILALSTCEDNPTKRLAASIDAHYLKPVGCLQIEQILAGASGN